MTAEGEEGEKEAGEKQGEEEEEEEKGGEEKEEQEKGAEGGRNLINPRPSSAHSLDTCTRAILAR